MKRNACSKQVPVAVVLHARFQPDGWAALVTLVFPLVFRVFF